MSELVGNEGKVFAFEPEAHNFQLLKNNLQSNGCDNVRLFNCAVSDREGIARIELNPINYGDHRIATNATDTRSASQEVKTTTLDKALSELPDGAVRFVKIDVQGHEMNVLRGMTETLRRNPDLILMVEVSPDILPQAGSSAAELVGFLYEQGFEGWELQDYRIFPSLAPWTYELIREQRWADVIFSRNKELLRCVMSDYCGKEIFIKTGAKTGARASCSPEREAE
jgi:FkbM family methyltransferase